MPTAVEEPSAPPPSGAPPTSPPSGGAGAPSGMEPYRPPPALSAVRRVAYSSKSFRVFGLQTQAWRSARRDWRMTRGGSAGSADSGAWGGDGSGGDGSGGDGSDSEGEGPTNGADSGGRSGRGTEEEGEELALICDALTTALSDDAGGYGTAGFHASRVDNVRLLAELNGESSPPCTAFAADLVPCDPETADPIDPISLVLDEGSGEIKYQGEDGKHLAGYPHREEGKEEGDNGTFPRFQVRVTISRAAEGASAAKLYSAAFLERKRLARMQGIEVMDDEDMDKWASEDETLGALRQALLDAKEGRGSGGGEDDEVDAEGAVAGYYVEVSLLGPDAGPREVSVPPPTELDRANPPSTARASSFASRASSANSSGMIGGDGDDEEGDDARPRGAYARDVFESDQFGAAGPWERANVKAFQDIVLDVRKALVRVEFPDFPEGCKGRTFREVYQLNARLKSGSFATVCRGTHRATGKKIAVKCVLRKDLPPGDDASIYDEVLILSTLRHRYICPLVDFFEERECYFLIMELMSGGDLFDRIGKRKNYTEDDARGLCRKMLESVRYCHENSVAHCDMKPKNLLLVSDDDDVQMKLADFGFATRVYEPRSLTKQCGTPFFVAPEVLMRSPYDQQSDMWSCGVIMFLLLGGDLPFMGRSQKELFRNIVMGRYEFEEDGWAHVSDQAKDLVRKLLVTDPSKRLSSREAMASPWMRQRGNMLARNNLMYTSQRLKGFNARMKLRASMIAVGSVVSLRLSVRNMTGRNSSLGLSSSSGAAEDAAARQPSFLGELPDEEPKEDEEEEEDGEEVENEVDC